MRYRALAQAAPMLGGVSRGVDVGGGGVVRFAYPPEAPVIRASFPSISLSTAGILDCGILFTGFDSRVSLWVGGERG